MRTVRSSIRRLKRAKKNAKKTTVKHEEHEQAHELAGRLTIGMLVRAKHSLVAAPWNDLSDGTTRYDVMLRGDAAFPGTIGTDGDPPVLMYLESKWLGRGTGTHAWPSTKVKYHLFSLQGKTVIVPLEMVVALD